MNKVNPTFEFLRKNLSSIVVFDTENHYPIVVFNKSIFENELTIQSFKDNISSSLNSFTRIKTLNIILAIEETKMHADAITGAFQFNVNQDEIDRTILLNTHVDLYTLTTDHFRNFLVEVNELFGE